MSVTFKDWKTAARAAQDRGLTAHRRYGGYSSPHEVLGVLEEEYLELKMAIHENDHTQFRTELIDIAAVCLRAASELTLREVEGQI